MGGESHGHHHDHGRPYEIPDWKQYRVKDVPELLQAQKYLASKGLKDPWLRNEVWRYNRGYGHSPWSRIFSVVFRGFKWGFGAFLVTIAYEKLFVADDHHRKDHGHH